MVYILSIAELSADQELFLTTKNCDTLEDCHESILEYIKDICAHPNMEFENIQGWKNKKKQTFEKQLEIYIEGLNSYGYQIEYTITHICTDNSECPL